MYILKFSKKNKEATQLEERLGQMSLAFKTELNSDLNEIVLAEGQKEVIGFKNINAHLDELNKELHNWYYCNC